MNEKNIEITNEMVKKAEQNGISRNNLFVRINRLGWSEKIACTKPVRKGLSQKISPELKARAKELGLSIETIRHRHKVLNWSLEDACTIPNIKEKVYAKIPKNYREMAKKNGISNQTLNVRINSLGWSLDKACTTPVKGFASKSYIRDGLEYASYSRRLKYNPEFHENHRQGYTDDDLMYMVSMWESDMPKAEIAMAIGKTHSAVMRKIYLLRKQKKYEYYKEMAKNML